MSNRKKINNKSIKLIKYYQLINYNLIYNNQPINRYKNFNKISINKVENLNKLKKMIANIKNCELKKR